MSFLNDFKNAGGRVTTGSDSGFIYQTYGFGYILELEMLQEAGFHPLEVIRSATLNGAQTLHEPKGKPIDFGIIRPGLLADMVIVDQNPLENFKVLYATGAVKLERSEPPRRARRRRQVHHQGRHRLRREEAGRRCGGDRRAREAAPLDVGGTAINDEDTVENCWRWWSCCCWSRRQPASGICIFAFPKVPAAAEYRDRGDAGAAGARQVPERSRRRLHHVPYRA